MGPCHLVVKSVCVLTGARSCKEFFRADMIYGKMVSHRARLSCTERPALCPNGCAVAPSSRSRSLTPLMALWIIGLLSRLQIFQFRHQPGHRCTGRISPHRGSTTSKGNKYGNSGAPPCHAMFAPAQFHHHAAGEALPA